VVNSERRSGTKFHRKRGFHLESSVAKYLEAAVLNLGALWPELRGILPALRPIPLAEARLGSPDLWLKDSALWTQTPACAAESGVRFLLQDSLKSCWGEGSC
jgi:hypothetical protein